ncbi:hypothetical protein AC579_242 [Pseudocercospora musae]|uniref:Uncharacterized protein n=1 Tax=Pseudocercospora musae TaxID=113226 RepID=A0A139I0N2_9PEZI|nr:hypothetical protein AC579_242 [Pseudocercospora musae]
MIPRSGHFSLIPARDRGRFSTKTVKRSWPTQCFTHSTTRRSTFGSIATTHLRQEAAQTRDCSPAKSVRKRYSLDEDTVIVVRKAEGFSLSSIAEELNRSKNSVSQRVDALCRYYPSVRKRRKAWTPAAQAEVDSIQRSIFDDGLSVAEVCRKTGRSDPYVRRRLDPYARTSLDPVRRHPVRRHPRPQNTDELEALVLAMKAEGYKYESIAHNLDIGVVKVQNVLAAHSHSRQRTPNKDLKRTLKQRVHHGWAAAEDSKLLEFYEQGQRAPEMARELNRSLLSTRNRLRELLISKGRLVPNGKLRYGRPNLEAAVNLREKYKLTWKQIAERFPEGSFRVWQWRYYDHKKRVSGKS